MKVATTYFQLDPKLIGLFLGFALVVFGLAASVSGQVEGFTEPFRTVDLSSDETGTISLLTVEQGHQVQEGDLIAKLDDSVQQLQLELAEHMAGLTSALQAAQTTYDKRLAIHKRIKDLIATNNASESELIRADMELSIAKSKLLAAKEEIATRQIETRRAKAQLDRRSIRSPFTGIVDKIHRHEGEFLSPLRPEVITLVQLDRLFATFNVPSERFTSCKVGQEFELKMGNGKVIKGKIYSIGVQTDAQSGTVEVKLVIENSSMEIRSGEICTLNI